MTPMTNPAQVSHRSSAVMVFPCRWDALDDLAEWVQAIGHRHGISDRHIFGLKLVLVEIATNIVDYSGNSNAGSPISVTIRFEPNHIWAQVEDAGP
ncbi:MAG: ATP-binding protein [Anaerolineales bacterium]|nr:ATP-binding protein [Anaerolineales bacterium]